MNRVLDGKAYVLAFGQEEHLRIKGDDSSGVLEFHIIVVKTVNEHNFSDDIVREILLFPFRFLPHPLATNYRNVYFEHKPRVVDRIAI